MRSFIPADRHFERSEKSSLHSTFSCSFRKRFPLFRYHTYDIIPSCKKDPSTSLGMTLRKQRFPNISFIRDVGYPSPIPSFRAQREIFLALCSFLLPSQKVSPFPLSHIRHYPLLQERSLDFARDDDTGIALSKHIRCTLREINLFSRYRHFERSEKSSLHSALSCSFRKRFPLFRYHTYSAIPVCQKDPSTSLGMTLREWCFPNISVVRYVK
jgi:muconolactone delta-isomerase